MLSALCAHLTALPPTPLPPAVLVQRLPVLPVLWSHDGPAGHPQGCSHLHRHPLLSGAAGGSSGIVEWSERTRSRAAQVASPSADGYWFCESDRRPSRNWVLCCAALRCAAQPAKSFPLQPVTLGKSLLQKSQSSCVLPAYSQALNRYRWLVYATAAQRCCPPCCLPPRPPALLHLRPPLPRARPPLPPPPPPAGSKPGTLCCRQRPL